MIRVVYLVDAPFLGGAEWYVSRLATGLDRRRFAPSVVLRANDTDASLEPWASALETQGIRVEGVSMRLPFHPWDAVGIHRAIAARAPDVVHVNMPGPYSGQTGLLVPIARAAGARVVVTEHLPMVERLWKRALVKEAAVRWADMAVTMTRANARLMVERQGYRIDRVRVIENGVPRDYGGGRRASRKDPVFTFLFVGNLIPYKGLQLLIEALSMMPPAPWRLRVVGTGPDEAAARALARQRHLAERVVFHGRASADEVEAILGDCDALVLPSSMEGLPYVILEAMACAKPVVSTRVFGIPEAVVDGETGLLVEPGDAAALSVSLRALIDDPALCARLGRAGRARFEERFTLERQIASMSRLYGELVGAWAPRGDGGP